MCNPNLKSYIDSFDRLFIYERQGAHSYQSPMLSCFMSLDFCSLVAVCQVPQSFSSVVLRTNWINLVFKGPSKNAKPLKTNYWSWKVTSVCACDHLFFMTFYGRIISVYEFHLHTNSTHGSRRNIIYRPNCTVISLKQSLAVFYLLMLL